MIRDSRNHYSTLFVQPDAPPEVIKAAWRALMSARRVHPDLGGDHDEAVRLNTAYEVLGDPVRRAAYDSGRQAPPLSRPTAAAAAPPAAASPSEPPPAAATDAASPGRRCPFCGQAHTASLRRETRCDACGSPLALLPERVRRPGRPDGLHGRRQDPRFARDAIVELWLPGESQPRRARLQDLSFSGLQLQVPLALPRGSVARVVAPWFDALFTVVNVRSLRTGYAVHGRLQTLLTQQQARGVYVNAQA
jgi:curved DNA-binding protein CbpA